MILKNDFPKTCSYTRIILYSLQHFNALQLHIKTITAITSLIVARVKFEPESSSSQVKFPFFF